ncbi:cell envelope biogenesis protein OmpA [Rhizobium daejeonense]
MFETAFALSLTHFARSLSFPERLQRRPGRNAALEPWRLRNANLDAFFYDVKALTAEETFYVSDVIAAEGLIMIVPPTGAGMLTLCDTVDEYLLRGGRNVHALTVAGVGGSAIGAAAFARNVADAIGEPVAAVVSGYGLGDIVNEAVGGAFFFGWLGHMRNDLEVLDDMVGRPQLGAYQDRHLLELKPNGSCLDADTVKSLLANPELSFHLLAGHSRGNRVLSEALYALKLSEPKQLRKLASGLRVVTFGGRITMPPECRNVIDVIGEFDWFGEINSRPLIESDVRVPYAGHSTNTGFPGALSVTKILKEIIARSLPAVIEEETAAPEKSEPPVEIAKARVAKLAKAKPEKVVSTEPPAVASAKPLAAEPPPEEPSPPAAAIAEAPPSEITEDVPALPAAPEEPAPLEVIPEIVATEPNPTEEAVIEPVIAEPPVAAKPVVQAKPEVNAEAAPAPKPKASRPAGKRGGPKGGRR